MKGCVCFNQNLHPLLHSLVNLGGRDLQAGDPVARPPSCPPTTGQRTRRGKKKKKTAGKWGFGHRATKARGMQRVNPPSQGWGATGVREGVGGVGDKRTQPETKVGRWG